MNVGSVLAGRGTWLTTCNSISSHLSSLLFYTSKCHSVFLSIFLFTRIFSGPSLLCLVLVESCVCRWCKEAQNCYNATYIWSFWILEFSAAHC